MAQRSLKVVTAVGPLPACASVTSRAAPRAKTACEAHRPSLAQRSFGPRPAQPQLSRGLLSTKEPAASRPSDVASACPRAIVTAVSPSLAFASLASKTAPRGEVVAASRLLAGLRKPRCRRPRLLMKRCESAKRRGRRCDSLRSNRRRIRLRISSVCAAGLLSTRDQALPLSLALPGSKLKP